MIDLSNRIEYVGFKEKTYRFPTVELEGIIYPVAYRVVTEDLRSLGLRRNPNIIEYPVGEWLFLPEEEVEVGRGDWGGIWLARTLPRAREIRKYMWERYSKKTRVFAAAMGDILFCNDGRVKTNAICMFREVYEEDE